MQKLDLSAFVREIRPILESTVASKIKLEYQLAGDLPWIAADASQLRQILINLVLNASEAIGDHSGSITIHTSARLGDREFLSSSQWSHPLSEGWYVMLAIADSGCGISQPTLGKIFDPFFSTKFTGRGLGLPAVAGIVRGHKGAIKVTSQPGAGYTFTVLLPVQIESPPSAPIPTSASPPASAMPAQRQGQVLLVDDEEQVRSVGRRLLGRLGFEVVTAANGPEAIAICRQNPAGCLCVLLDLTMPGMNGQETLHELRRVRADLPILMASGYSELELAEQFAHDGLSGFIQKPFTLQSLKTKLDQVLQAKPG
jgi:CheY-like chemotaxis protein